MNLNQRILHVDGDSFFASCEVALNPKLLGRAVWVGGGRKGDGIVIAANREAKKYGVSTGMACHDAIRACPLGVLCRPNYEEYRRLSREMFLILEQYAPTLVPISIDEGFLDCTTMDKVVWRHTTPQDYIRAIGRHIQAELGLPVSGGLANCSRLAKLATDAAKPGFIEVPAGTEKEFLHDRSVRELSGIGKNRERSLAALNARTFGDVAKLPSPLLKQRFGIWGHQLWLFAHGRWHEPLILEAKDRTTISSNTTLPYNESDYEAALTFALSESTRLVGQLRREQLQLRELSLTLRYSDFTESGSTHRFQHSQCRNSVVNAAIEGIFRELISTAFKPIRQIRLAMWNLSRLEVEPTLWGKTDGERFGALDDATHLLNERFHAAHPKKPSVMTGAQLALRQLDEANKNPKSKCPFVPQREIMKKLWGTDADPLKRLTEWEQRLAEVSKQSPFHG